MGRSDRFSFMNGLGALVIGALLVSWIQVSEFFRLTSELHKHQEREAELSLPETKKGAASHTTKEASHVLLSDNPHLFENLHPEILSRSSIFNISKTGSNADVFLHILSLVPDADTYTIINPSEAFVNSSLMDTLDALVWASSENSLLLSHRFFAVHPSFFSFSRKVWDWRNVPQDASTAWILKKAQDLFPLIHVVNVNKLVSDGSFSHFTEWDAFGVIHVHQDMHFGDTIPSLFERILVLLAFAASLLLWSCVYKRKAHLFS